MMGNEPRRSHNPPLLYNVPSSSAPAYYNSLMSDLQPGYPPVSISYDLFHNQADSLMIYDQDEDGPLWSPETYDIMTLPRNRSGPPSNAQRIYRSCELLPITSDNYATVTQERQENMFNLDELSTFYCAVDFTRTDALRERALIVEGQRLYVDDNYLGVWSTVFRNMVAEAGGSNDRRDIALPGKRYEEIMELLECLYPQQKPIDEMNYQLILRLSHEYQIHGLLRKCIKYLLRARMSLMDKIVLADRYELEDFLNLCLHQIRQPNQLDFDSRQYHSLSDRTKVRLLERVHNPASQHKQLEQTLSFEEDETDVIFSTRFCQKSDLHFGTIRGKSGTVSYCNPFYLAAWSNLLHEQVIAMNSQDLVCSARDEEIAYFLRAIHPPLPEITDENVAWILRSACKLESVGLMRMCANHLLNNSHSVSLFEKISLLDRCYLHELMDPCMSLARSVKEALKMTQHSTYDTLSMKAKATILDRIAVLLCQGEDDLQLRHTCQHCKRKSTCENLKVWLCGHCGNYGAISGLPVVMQAPASRQMIAGNVPVRPQIAHHPDGIMLQQQRPLVQQAQQLQHQSIPRAVVQQQRMALHQQPRSSLQQQRPQHPQGQLQRQQRPLLQQQQQLVQQQQPGQLIQQEGPLAQQQRQLLPQQQRQLQQQAPLQQGALQQGQLQQPHQVLLQQQQQGQLQQQQLQDAARHGNPQGRKTGSPNKPADTM